MKAFDTKAYWENRLDKHNDLQGVGYERLGTAYNQWMYRVRRREFFRQMKTLPLNHANLDVLDIGSGTGFYVQLWKELGVKSVTGVDLTKVAVEKLGQNYPEYNFYELNIGSSDLGELSGKQFDCITAIAIFLHIVDKAEFEQAIANVRKLLKPGGYLIYTDSFLHREPPAVNSASHVALRSLKYYEDIMKQNGFEIVKRVPQFVLMNQPIDTNKSYLKWAWKAMSVVVSLHNILGFLIGMLLYPLEILCLSLFKESPTTEIMICKAVDQSG